MTCQKHGKHQGWKDAWVLSSTTLSTAVGEIGESNDQPIHNIHTTSVRVGQMTL